MNNSEALTARQQAAVRHRGGNLLVDAVPGSGKTRVIVARCAALLAVGVPANEILVLTFSRKAVAELDARVAAAIGPSAQPEIRTFHGFAARLLADAGEAGRSRRLLSEPAERTLFEHVVASTTLHSFPSGVANSPLFRDTAATRVDEIRRAPHDGVEKLATVATPRLRDLIALDATQTHLRDRFGVADFDDLVARAARLAATPGSPVATAVQSRYSHVLVDEFQDTDPLQLALLETFRAEIFAVGDEAQAIYGFRGAARDAMSVAQTRLAMQRLPLDESFRCPSAVCELASAVRPSTTVLRSRATGMGEITYRRAASPRDEAACIADAIVAAIADGIPLNTIAVLLRKAEPMATFVATELRTRGIPVTRQGGENVRDDPAVDAIGAALGALATPNDSAVWVRLFAHPAFDLDSLAVRLLLAKQPPRSVTDALALLQSLPPFTTGVARRVATALASAQAFWAQNEPVRAARAFAAESDLLGFVARGDEDGARASGRRISTYLAALGDVRDVRAKLELDPTSAAVFRAFAASSEGWRAESDRASDSAGVALLTVHAAKGLEFEFVALADAVEGHFPQLWRPDTLLGPAELALARDCGVDLGTNAPEHDSEERSLWYVAVTRSQRKLSITWSEADAEGSPLRPSRFLPLAARTAETALPSFRGPLTFAAASNLSDAQLPTAAHIARPIGVSTIGSWFACRRRFYYDTLLKIGSDERNFNAKLGVLVHRAIAHFHEAVRDFRAVDSGAPETWVRTLQDLARAIVSAPDFAAFDSPLETGAALRSADRLLGRYAHSLATAAQTDGGAFEVIATEEAVQFTVDGVAFSGRIDRIDRQVDGLLALVDVKTGKPKSKGAMVEAFPKLAEVAAAGKIWSNAASPANPQLPLYRHAKPETATLAYVYLGTESKFGKYNDTATDDRLDVSTDAAALAAIDSVLAETFFKPWATATLTSLEPTRFARTCRYCEFENVCPGYLEDDDA